jgi:hypothetical protein
MREESAKESAERRLRAGLRQGRAYVDAFSHTISRRLLLFGLTTTSTTSGSTFRYPLPCSVTLAAIQPTCSPRALSNKLRAAVRYCTSLVWCTLPSRHQHICPRLLTLTFVSATNPTRPSPESTQVTQIQQHLPLSNVPRWDVTSLPLPQRNHAHVSCRHCHSRVERAHTSRV